jgi:alpha-glucosidase
MKSLTDGGYDIQDFKEVDPIYGTNADLEELFAKAKDLGLKIILDLVSL